MVAANNIDLSPIQINEIESYKDYLRALCVKYGVDCKMLEVTPLAACEYSLEVFVMEYSDSSTKPGVYQLKTWKYTLYPNS